MSSKLFKTLFLIKKLYKNSRWIILLAITLIIDWLLFSPKFNEIRREIVEDEAEDFVQKTTTTITQLISTLQINKQITLKLPYNKIINQNKSKEYFTYKKIICYNLIKVSGYRNNFRICYPPRLLFREYNRQAFFINGERDEKFEKNFQWALLRRTKLKVFTLLKNKSDTSINYLVENVTVKGYSEDYFDFKGRRIIGIKDLFDLYGDYYKIEFIKFEMIRIIDPIVYSVNIPVFASHLLLRIEKFSLEELQKLIERLANALYLPYTINYDKENDVYFASFMHKYALYKYGINENVVAANLTLTQ